MTRTTRPDIYQTITAKIVAAAQEAVTYLDGLQTPAAQQSAAA